MIPRIKRISRYLTTPRLWLPRAHVKVKGAGLRLHIGEVAA